MRETDYTLLVAEDTYELLTSVPNPWPRGFTRHKKVEFIDLLLDFLEERQQYERCERLRKLREDVLNGDLFDSKEKKG
jgi:hypothetical protein